MKQLLLIALLISSPSSVWAQKSDKGLLPELKLEKNNEDANQKKAVQSEVLITRSEFKAIQALNAVLKKKRGTPQEADLWFRLAELYMRRAKSGRFFDLTRGQDDSPVKFAPPEVRDESAIANLRQAIGIYTKIERDFPGFREMDVAMFNNAFASQQIGQKKNAEATYARMIQKHPKSTLIPDAHLATGEMRYDAGQFAMALEDFRAIEKFPGSRVYSYGLYKQAWTNYNLKQNEAAIEKLLDVVKFFDSKNTQKIRASHNLRSEALRDLALFFGETHPADEAYEFFAKVCTPAELGEAMMNLGKLYDSHGRQKEMNVFLAQYIKKHEYSPLRIKIEMLLIQGNETLRNRPGVIKHMEAAADVCRPHSAWRKQEATSSEADCDYDLAKANLDIAKKWWELWLKNKSNKEMADLTERAFKIHLDREDPLKPDVKSHFAYAELLFQQDKFREASGQYEFAANKSADTQIAHDAAYAALVSLEKASEKSEESGDKTKLVELSKTYLTKYPTGVQAPQVKFKIGFLAYEEKNDVESEKWLRPLALDLKQDPKLRLRSQDLMLDILNARQDLGGLRDFSKKIMDQSDNADRQQSMQKIMQEADFNIIQKKIEKEQVTESIQKLVAFHNENKSTTVLAKKALKQAMSLAFSSSRSLEGADLAIQYARTYPDDTETTAALREAAKHYNEQGFLLRAVSTFELLTPRLKGQEQTQVFEAISEIYVLENRKQVAREFLGKLLDSANKKDHGKIYSRLMQTYKGEETTPEYAKLEKKILSLNIQPSASEILLKRVQRFFAEKRYTEAFNSAKALVGSEAPPTVRAQARLIQAQVLEWEMTSQSTKTTLDRLPLVLSIKTEKLEKAQSAFLAAASYSKDANVQLSTLEGLARLYKDYVDTVGSPTIKTALMPEEQKALTNELTNLVKPIEQKQKDIEKKLVDLAKAQKTATTAELDFANLPLNETVKPTIPLINFDHVGPYLPKLTQGEGLFVAREEPTAGPCQVEAKDLQKDFAGLMTLANRCLAQKKFTKIDKIAARIAELEPKSGIAPFYLSLAAFGLGLKEKSLYLIELALKKNNDQAFFWYQKAIVLGAMGDRAGANQWMIKAFDERLDAWETKLFHGVVAFSGGDCFSVADDFKAIPVLQMERFDLAPALSECMAQKGEIDQALRFAQKSFDAKKSLTLALQLGHLAEVYKSDNKLAAQAYEKAHSASSIESQKEWLKRKIEWLNKPGAPVTQADSSHVSSQVARGNGSGGK
jgi:TolA-binding protein